MTVALRPPCDVCQRRGPCEHRPPPTSPPNLELVPPEPPDDDPFDERDPAEAREERMAARVAAELEKREVRRRADAVERPPSHPPSSVSLRELLARPRVETKYLVDQMWPAGGKVLITAPKKSGKTTLVGNLIRCLVDGEPFLAGSFAPGDWRARDAGFDVPAPDGRLTFLLDFEMTEHMLVEWLGDQRIREQDNVHVELMRGRTWDIRDDKVRTEWATYLQKLNVGKLIVDPIGPVIHGLGIDENDNSQVGRFLAALDMLAAEAGIDEYAAVHHAGHGEEQRARGASSFLGWPDAIWQITRSDDGSFIQAEGRDVRLTETALVFDRSTRRLSLGEGNRSSARSAGHVTTVAAIVDETSGLTVRKLIPYVAEALGCGTEVARSAIKAAVSARTVHVHKGPNSSQMHYGGARCDGCA